MTNYSRASANYVLRLADTFTELADNAFYHAGRSVNSGWGYVHAQVYQKGNFFWKKGYIRIAISDIGVGLYGSYKRTNQIRNRTEEQILLEAFEQGESCLNPVPKRGHRGIGLYEALEFIQKVSSGILVLISGSTRVTASAKGLKSENLRYPVAGTWIELQVPIL